jgi:hypothetical protein
LCPCRGPSNLGPPDPSGPRTSGVRMPRRRVLRPGGPSPLRPRFLGPGPARATPGVPGRPPTRSRSAEQQQAPKPPVRADQGETIAASAIASAHPDIGGTGDVPPARSLSRTATGTQAARTSGGLQGSPSARSRSPVQLQARKPPPSEPTNAKRSPLLRSRPPTLTSGYRGCLPARSRSAVHQRAPKPAPVRAGGAIRSPLLRSRPPHPGIRGYRGRPRHDPAQRYGNRHPSHPSSGRAGAIRSPFLRSRPPTPTSGGTRGVQGGRLQHDRAQRHSNRHPSRFSSGSAGAIRSRFLRSRPPTRTRGVRGVVPPGKGRIRARYDGGFCHRARIRRGTGGRPPGS